MESSQSRPSDPSHSFRRSFPFASSNPSKPVFQSASPSLPTYESAVYFATHTFLRLATPSLQLTLNPSKLHFTLSCPTPFPFRDHQPLSPLYPLAVLSSLHLTSISPNSTPTLPPPPPDHITFLSVHDLFHPLPIRQRIEKARHPIQIQTATRDLLVALSLSNPHVSFSVFAPESHLLFNSPSASLSVEKIESAFGITPTLDWCPVLADFIRNGLIARNGADTSSICLISVDATPLLETGWAHNLVNRAWESYNTKKFRKAGTRFPAYVLNLTSRERDCLTDGVSPSVEIERGLEEAIRNALSAPKREVSKPTTQPILSRNRRPATNRFAEAIVMNKIRRVSKWEQASGLNARRRLMRPFSEPICIPKNTPGCTRLCIDRPKSVEGVEWAYKRHVAGWKNPCFPGTVRAAISNEGRSRVGNLGLVSEAGKQAVSITKESLLKLRVIAQVDRKFIIAVHNETVLYAVDQHAISERYLYERFMKNASLGRIASMTLSCPKAISLSSQHRSTASRYAETLERWGWRVTFREEDMRIVGVPFLRKLKIALDAEEKLCEYLEQLHRGTSRIVTPRPIVDMVARAACHTAVRFGDDLTKEQCQALLKALRECDSPFICAHGRPSFVPLAVLKS